MYINARYDREADRVHVADRTPEGRVFREFIPDHSFYVEDPRGTHKSMYGTAISKMTPNNRKDKARLLKIHEGKRKFESDIDPISRILEQEYSGYQPAHLNVAFFDIETDFDQDRGYSDPSEAFNPITSIAVYLQWLKQMVCIAVPPRGMSRAEADAIAAEVGDVIIADTEAEMLQMFISLIADADVLSGWNSEYYDIPYTFNRTVHLFGKAELRKFCFWDAMPRRRTIERGGGEQHIWNLEGRVHLDYLELYKKYTYEERQSYSLDNIAEHELGEKKVAYDGTLDQLYNQDFKKFLQYNIQDTRLLDRLDEKLQYIDLINNIAFDTHVPLGSAMGSVAVVESAITAEAHRRGLRVLDKQHSNKDIRAAGGWVQQPKRGLHNYVGSVDLNSLYPSVLRALNMSNETIVGQIRIDKTNRAIEDFIAAAKKNSFAEWWNDRFNTLEMQVFLDGCPHEKIIFDMDSGESYELTGAEMRQLIFDSGQNWCISANGTVFRTDIEGIIPGLLGAWYADRKQMKKVLWNLIQLRTGLIKTDIDPSDVPTSVNLPDLKKLEYDELLNGIKAIESGEQDNAIDFISRFRLTIRDGAVWAGDDILKDWRGAEEFWDKRQLVKKILLNSLYGGLLNQHCRFFDQRLGQSTTLTGRSITRHMAAKANELLAGEYDETGRAVIYGDSVVGETVIETSTGPITIEELYNRCHTFDNVGEKEYGFDKGVRVASYDRINNKAYFGNINYVYRHKVKKRMFEITDEHNNAVIVTEDHSVMIKRGKNLIEVKPQDIVEGDIVLTLNIR